MDIIEVDPKLFVTCRLCLEDLGQFQIVPSVQQQIKYCFDIDVQPFDGLPQLLCLKCREILNKFNTVKTTFCEKQANLKNRVLNKDEISVPPQQDTVSSSQQTELNYNENEGKIETNIKNSTKSKKKRVIHSSSSDEEICENSHSLNKPPKQSKKLSSKKVKTEPWQFDYEKQFACRLCNSSWSKVRSFVNHNRTHDVLKAKYKNILTRQCSVSLEKFDSMPNVTGASNMVQISCDKIIAPGNLYYYTMYAKRKNSTSIYNSTSRNSSDDDDEVTLKPKSSKRRLLSKSSNETVVIENCNNDILSDNDDDSKTASQNSIDGQMMGTDQCINIVDSSESESNSGNLDSRQKVKQPMEAKFGDYKIIQGIISMCVNAYHKKNDLADIDTYMNVMQNKKNDKEQVSNESQLKHKLLSIGRKVINKQGFNCTGLLRYMEHKNLEISWIPKLLLTNANKETNYIRILTKLRGQGTPDDNLGWVNVDENAAPVHSVNVMAVTNNLDQNEARNSMSTVSITKNTVQDSDNSEQTATGGINQFNNVQELLDVETLPALLYLDNNASNSDSKKLLNANPVANPKQLPKKLVSLQNVCHSESDDPNYCMPIITSTTSLATPNNEEQNKDTGPFGSMTVSKITAPRIKVKPASELMSERILNSIRNEKSASSTGNNTLPSETENAWSQQPINIYVPSMSQHMQVTSPPVQIMQMPCITIGPTYQVVTPPDASNIPRDHVILDTIEFPNTKTESPFKYFKDLLQIHNLVLLDAGYSLSRDYYCLIKFKVLFKQEINKDFPVVLCLGLFCLQNSFCLKIRDGNLESVDINKLTANWQWEILQIYRGEVVNKILQNAQKISQTTCDFTNKFFCLLKSIKCIKP